MASTFTETTDPGSRVPEYPPTSPRKLIAGQLIADGATGATVGDIPASLFGLTFIERASAAVKDDNSLIVVVAPSFDGTSLLGKAAATAAPDNIPAGTYNLVLFGY